MTIAPATPPLVSGTPLLGSLREFRSSPVGLLSRVARDYGDIATVRLGLRDVLVVSCPELVHEVLVTQAGAFSKSPALRVFGRPLLGDGLLTSEDELHRRQRRLLAPAFTQERIAAYAQTMVERSAHSLARMLAAPETDLCAESMQVTLEIVAKTLFDADVGAASGEVGAALTDAMQAIVSAFTAIVPLPPWLPTPANLRLRRATRRLDRIVYRMIDERRQRPQQRGDMLSMLLAARDEQDATGMSERQVRDEAMTIFLAGHETTANAVAWAVYLLARHPEIQAALEAELSGALVAAPPSLHDLPRLPLTLRVLKETMRLYPPAYVLSRRARKALRLGGHPVREGQIVVVNVFGLHRRADLFPEPARFDPERFTKERESALPRQAYMPFGGGARMCIGNRFALMEGQLILATWLQRARFELVEPEQTVEWEPLITLRPRAPLRVRVRARDA